MSFDKQIEFTKDNIDTYLKEVAREYRKRAGKNMPAEIILIGGASVMINYGFRNMTTDVDAMIRAASCMKDAINIVGDRYDLPHGWMNSEFVRSESYSSKIPMFSSYYKTFANVVEVRTITSEYLIAMKLRSGRQYKSDLSDILGILAELVHKGEAPCMEDIRKAVTDLYGSWESLPEGSRSFIELVMADGDFESLYKQVREGEQDNDVLLLSFDRDNTGILNNTNVNDLLEDLQTKSDRASILDEIRKRKKDE